jgi:hypothetical protein
MTKVHLQNKWVETNNSVCALLRQAHDVLALTSLPMQQVRKPLTEKEISETCDTWIIDSIGIEEVIFIVRRTELHHGIGVEE